MSDLIFATRALQQKFYAQGILGLVFVLVPWAMNFVVLERSQRKWIKDSSIKYAVSRWLLKYNKKLILLTALCGSAFAAIELCNSRAFRRGLFNMGLTESHIKKFQAKRIYSTVIFENVPQLCVQIWYFIDRDETDIVTTLAFLSSLASIFIASVDVYSSMSLLRVE